MDATAQDYFTSDYFTSPDNATVESTGLGRSVFDSLSSLAAPLAGVFTAVNNRQAQNTAANAATRIAQANAAATQSWTRWIPFGIGAVVILGAIVFVVSLFRGKK